MLADLIRRQPASKERTRFAWRIAVGPAIARVTTVDADADTLVVRCLDPRWMPELTRARALVLTRLQQLLGPQAVKRLTIAAPDTPPRGRDKPHA